MKYFFLGTCAYFAFAIFLGLLGDQLENYQMIAIGYMMIIVVLHFWWAWLLILCFLLASLISDRWKARKLRREERMRLARLRWFERQHDA